MNASSGKNLSRVSGLLLLALLAGCMAPFKTQTDAQSPLSQRVEALVEANREYPRWEDFPATPVPPPSNAEVAVQVAGLGRQAEDLGARAAAIEWTLSEPQAYAASVRERASAPISAATARTAAEVEAFARSLRERSEAPPPIDPRR